MSIVTKKGDDGTTALMYGRRVGKTDPRVEANGAVDELNAALGVVRTLMNEAPEAERLRLIQTELVALMGEVATHPEDWERYAKDGFSQVTAAEIARLESAVRSLERRVVVGKDFVMPGGHGRTGAALDMARAICRRAERRLCELKEASVLRNPRTVVYLNRLSDYLWLLARWSERSEDKPAVDTPPASPATTLQ